MRWPLVMRRVTGGSMEPSFFPGQVVVAWRWWRRLKRGDVVIIRHNGVEKIKRVERIDGDDIWVLGDNANASTDSRHFGAVPRDTIVAKVAMAPLP